VILVSPEFLLEFLFQGKHIWLIRTLTEECLKCASPPSPMFVSSASFSALSLQFQFCVCCLFCRKMQVIRAVQTQ